MQRIIRSLSFLTIFILFSCATNEDEKKKKTEAEKLYLESKELVDSSRYILATEKLNLLKTNYPYSYFAKYADLLLADILYKQENYAEATASYLLYRDLHPKDKEIPYVVYKIAESYFMQVPSTIDRDLASAEKAIMYFNELLQKYPGSEFVDGANKKIESCKKMLRDKEQYVADFYFKTKKYLPAKIRYLGILQKFSDQGDIEMIRHSMLRIVQASQRLNEFEKCLEYGKEFRGVLGEQREIELEKTINKCEKRTEEK